MIRELCSKSDLSPEKEDCADEGGNRCDVCACVCVCESFPAETRFEPTKQKLVIPNRFFIFKILGSDPLSTISWFFWFFFNMKMVRDTFCLVLIWLCVGHTYASFINCTIVLICSLTHTPIRSTPALLQPTPIWAKWPQHTQIRARWSV